MRNFYAIVTARVARGLEGFAEAFKVRDKLKRQAAQEKRLRAKNRK